MSATLPSPGGTYCSRIDLPSQDDDSKYLTRCSRRSRERYCAVRRLQWGQNSMAMKSKGSQPARSTQNRNLRHSRFFPK